MHFSEIVALWYICIIKSVCVLLKVLVFCLLTFSSTDSASTLGHYFYCEVSVFVFQYYTK